MVWTPTPFGVGRNACWSSRKSLAPGALSSSIHFLPFCPLNDSKKAALSLFKIGRMSLLFSCLSLTLIFALPLFLTSGSVHPNTGCVFPWSVCAGNVTWRIRLSTELQHFISFHPFDLICIQKPNLNSFPSFRIS